MYFFTKDISNFKHVLQVIKHTYQFMVIEQSDFMAKSRLTGVSQLLKPLVQGGCMQACVHGSHYGPFTTMLICAAENTLTQQSFLCWWSTQDSSVYADLSIMAIDILEEV